MLLMVIGGSVAAVTLIARHQAVFDVPDKKQLALDIAAFKRRQTATFVAPESNTARPLTTSGEPLRSEPKPAVDQPQTSFLFVERDDAMHGFRGIAWCVMLDDRAVGEPSGGKLLAISLGNTPGLHKITVDWRSRPTSVQPLSVQVGIPEDHNAMLTFRGQKCALGYEVVMGGRRILNPNEVGELSVTTAVVDGSYPAPLWMGPKFNFHEVFWQKTSILFGFYWLFRWLCPSVLPNSLRELDFRMTIIPCAILGLIWTGISFLLRLGAKPQDNSTNTGGQNG
jgi:hypothetical protein